LFKGTLAGRPCSVLIDTGASFSFLDEGWLQQNAEWLKNQDRLDIHALDCPLQIAAANGNF